jgi:hypothetical protein
MVKRRISRSVIALVLVCLAPHLQGQGRFPLPRFGPSTVGDDYFLANYTQFQEYWTALAKTTDRMKVVEIGKTAEGRPLIMAIISSPENLKNLQKYKDISAQLARAEGVTEGQARALAAEGKAVVWLNGGLHSNEIVNSEALFWTAYQFVSQNDPETMRILNDVIMLVTQVNPDGMELTANWYMRDPDPKKRNMQLPKLYNKYVGHDDNRDFYTAFQPETEAIDRQLFIEWMPQLVHDAHQSGPVGTILFTPPFRDPFNYQMDPMIPVMIDTVAAAITTRFLEEGKGGSVSRDEAAYDTWSNGTERTTTYFHNQVGILTEINGNPTPMEIGLVLDRQLPRRDVPMPIPPQKVWHFKQAIDYVLSVQRAILDLASRQKESFLFRIWRMGMNSIERGNKDQWTVVPSWIDQAKAAAAKEAAAEPGRRGAALEVGSATVVPSKYYDLMRTPERRDPRGYIIPSDQADFITATKFINCLIKAGVEVQRATGPFTVGGKSYPAGSYVLKAAQAFRPHLRDMLEPQDHGADFFYPGGPPRPPHDMTGYALALQMAVQFDRILDAFDGPFERLPFGQTIRIADGKVVSPAKGSAAGYLLSHEVKDSFTATNRLLAAKEDVYWLKTPFTTAGKTYPVGTIYVPSKATTRALVDKLSAEIGVSFEGSATRPTGEAFKLRPVRVGLWDEYGGNMPSGWVRWMFEQQFQFPTFEVVYPPQLDAGNLKAKYDVILFLAGIPEPGVQAAGYSRNAPPANLPPEWADKVGNVSVAKTIPQLRKFVDEGGTIIGAGEAANLAYHFGLPLTDHLVERTATGELRPVPPEKCFLQGVLVTANVDKTNPLAYGMPDKVDVFFDESPTFRLGPGALAQGVRAVAWYEGDKPVSAGWGWGQAYLQGGIGGVEAALGKGKVFLFGPEITFRAEPHGTFPFLFNAIYYGAAQSVTLSPAAKTSK